MDQQEVRKSLQSDLTEAKGYFSTQYKAITDDLEFATGNQWQDENLGNRSDRVQMTVNMVHTYGNKIINPLRKSPLGINITTDSPEMSEFLKGVVRNIEEESCASEAYESAYEHEVFGGLGWMYAVTDYEDDDSLNQTIRIEKVDNPTSVWIDPFSKKIDGSDARWGVIVNYIDRDSAEDMYGEGIFQHYEGVDVYSEWNVPEDSVAEILYYKLIEKKAMKYWYADGSCDFEGEKRDMMGAQIPLVGKRPVSKKHVECYKLVGQEVQGEPSILNIPWIPIVPAYGDRCYDKELRWSGIVRLLKSSQQMVNLYSSNEAELVMTAPISPWIIAQGQTKGYEDIWRTANTKAWDALVYNEVSLNGVSVPPPMRTDNRAQTEGLIASKQAAIQDLAREVGIFDPNLGADHKAESGKARILMDAAADMSNIHYLDNLSKSIEQMGRIVIGLLPQTFDTARAVPVTEEDGTKVTVQANLKEILSQLKNVDVTVDAGPAYESERREGINAMMEVGRIAPDKMSGLIDLVVEDLGLPSGDRIVKRLQAMLPPELRDDDENPLSPEEQQIMAQTQQAMQEQDAVINRQEQIIDFLQTKLVDNDKDRDTQVMVAEIRAQADLSKAQLTAQKDILIAQMKAENATETTIIKERGETTRQLEEIEADAVHKIAEIAAKKAASIEKQDVQREGLPLGNMSPPGGIV